MKTAFTYHRYSHDDQRTGHTLETQRVVTKKLAAKYEAQIIAVFEDEAISGATIDKRAGMLSLLEDLSKLKPNYLIATDQDRLSRSNDFWIIKSKLAKTNTSIITEKEGILDQADISKDALSDMLNVFAKMERRLTGKRIKRVFDERRAKGQYIGGTPIGYYRSQGKLNINEIEARFVKKIFDLVVQGYSSSLIVNILKPERLIFPGQIFRIVANPVYIGKMRFDETIIDANHEPIIDEEIYFRANEILEYRKLKNRTRPASYLLTGLLKCSKCGRSFNAMAGHYSYKDSKEYGYRCRGATISECFNSISGKIDEVVLERLYNKILKLKLDIDKGYKKYSGSIHKVKKAPLDDVKNIETKMTRLMDSYLAKIIDLETYRKKNDELKYQLESTKKEFKNTASDSDIINKAYEYIKNTEVEELFHDLAFASKRELVLMFINKVTVSPTSQGKHDYKKRIEIDWKTLV